MPGKTTDVPLSLFGGTNSELRPVDIPEGVSPDNQDVIFIPGSADSRPGTHKVYSDVLANTPTIVYVKTFVQPNGLPLTLSLDSNGILYQEDVFTSPGTRTQIGQVAKGARGFSITADGVEYLTFHDGKHGIDVPRQLNNGFLDRISQDGPAAAPVAAELAATVNIAGVNGIVAQSAAVNIASGNETGTLVTLVTATPHGLFAGQQVVISGIAVAGYNLTLNIQSVPDSTSFTYVAAGGLAAVGAGGTVQVPTVIVTTTTPHGMIAGAQFKIVGNSQAIYNNTTVGNPPTWPLQNVISPTSFAFVCGQTPVVGTGGTASVGGQISVGGHGAVVMFKTRSGFITKPSPVASWFASGGGQVHLTNLPIGPANVIARIIAFTGANGANYFYSLIAAAGIMATIVPDNTSTSVSLDFADTSLFGTIAIDIPGNNLFALHTLAPCLGVFFYASRLFAWGEFNKEDRLVNMGFEGGFLSGAPTVPLGWTVATAGGALVASPSDTGEAWQITGDGTGANKGQITQTGYQDQFFQPVLQPNTQYTFWAWAKPSAAGLAGTLNATISSVSSGFTITASITVNSFPTLGGFLSATFKLAGVASPTPAVIPSDMLLSISAANLPNGATLTIDELMMVFTAQPYRETQFRASYINNFESFDGITGVIGSTEDPNPLRCASSLRGTMYFQTTERMHETRDNGITGPEGWAVDEVANVGAMSVDSMTPVAKGEDWIFTASNGASGSGMYIFDGGIPQKISQEYQTFFDSINPLAKESSWLVNDPVKRRCYFSVPQSAAVTPNQLLVMDYRELDGRGDIASHGPIHISLSAKMVSSDLSRKWTRWNLPLNCGALVTRQDGSVQFMVGAGNGQALNAAPGFGNCYTFDTNKLTDDDFGQIIPYYFTYFFVNHEMEQQLQFGSHRKSYSSLTGRIIGVGNVIITPYINEMTNAQRSIRAIRLGITANQDFERNLQFSGERAAFKIAVLPLSGTTDVQMSIQKLVVTMKQETWTPVAGPR